MIQKIISGGQTGADQAGLFAAKKLGIKTGGWMTKGFHTLIGPRPDFKVEFNIKENTAPGYSDRTSLNVRDSDGTLRFAKSFLSPGEICTLKWIKIFKKPYLDVGYGLEVTPRILFIVKEWLAKNKVKVLNVAGNSEDTCPGIYKYVFNFLIKALRGTSGRLQKM